MRVIAGTAGSLPLKTIEGLDTRPTTDRIKDLFAGSGAIGIEALSRGAKEAVFVEKAPAAVSCIRANLAFTKLADRARVMDADVFGALARLDGTAPFDYIFMDPPYDHGLEKQVLLALQGRSFVDEDTVIIVEASKHTDFSYVEEYGYRIARRKEYKTNLHLFLQKQ